MNQDSPKDLAGNGRERIHHVDFLPPATRSLVMSRIKNRDTQPELAVQGFFNDAGLIFDR